MPGWLLFIIVFAVGGAIVGFLNSGQIKDALNGAVGGGCLAVGCLVRIAVTVLGLLLVFLLFFWLFCH